MSTATSVADLLDRADAERAAGRGDDAARLYDEAIDRCRAAGDVGPWTRAVLGAASVLVFGVEPGRLAAQLHDVLARTTDDADRARLGAALARSWAYSGHARRGAPFAAEALERAEQCGDPVVLADALDATLACHWGPDDLALRTPLGARLDDVAAHVLEPAVRLQAHLWGLQLACDVLDVQAIHRHLHALDRLGEESARARFYAVTRRLMYDLLRGRTDTVAGLLAAASEAEAEADLPDGWMVIAAMRGYSALIVGDPDTCAEAAAAAEAFAASEGVIEVAAEAGWLWTGAGRPDRATAVLQTFRGGVLDRLPKDVNWLLTMQCVLETALTTASEDVVEEAARLLAPYAGRAVFNAGAVMFHGLTDDTLARAAAFLGDHSRAERLRDQALRTYIRLGATWWHDRLRDWAPVGRAAIRLHPTPGGLWLVGAGPGHPLRPLRGLVYLRRLLAQPGKPIAALDLVTDGSATVLQPPAGEALDRRALAAYRHRLAEIDADLEEAAAWADLGRTEALQAERDALLRELSSSTGLSGRARLGGSTQERARVAATKAISTAIDRLTAVDPVLGAHLEGSVRTGTECCYLPTAGELPTWDLGLVSGGDDP